MRRALLAVFGALVASPLVLLAASEPPIDLAAERTAIARYREADQRLQDVGWQLARGNAAFCETVVPSIGLQLQDMASYGAPAIARAALGLNGDFAVQTAAKGSPAALAGGAFRPNREVRRFAGNDPNTWPAEAQGDWRRLVRVHQDIEQRLTGEGAVTIEFADGESVRLAPVPVCASRFELKGEGGMAVADGTRVVIGIGFPGFAYRDDAVFAGVVAHELAHNVLGHDDWVRRNGRSPRTIRLIEREADRLMPWLLANAGWPPEAAVIFMKTWGRAHDAGILRLRTRDAWDERVTFIAAEVPAIKAVLAREGKADWSRNFRREIDPAGGVAAPSVTPPAG